MHTSEKRILMKKLIIWFTSACLVASTLLTSCSSEPRVADGNVAHKYSRKPKFIDGITLGNNSNSISMNVIEHNKELAQLTPAKANILQTKYADILGVIPQAITNVSLYKFIDEWYGVNYRWGGSDKTGIDCSAFVQRLYEDVFGMSLVRTAMEQFHNCQMVWDCSKLKEGDLVFFHIHSRHITHVGIYLMNNFFVHASVSQGVVISSLTDTYWKRYFAGAGKILNNNRG